MSLSGVVELGERVVLLDEVQFLLRHLLGEPFVAIDIDLDSKRQPGLMNAVFSAVYLVAALPRWASCLRFLLAPRDFPSAVRQGEKITLTSFSVAV
jgi:hypothetical protein